MTADPGRDLHQEPGRAVSSAALLRDSRAPVREAEESFFTLHHGDSRRVDLILSQHSSRTQPLLTTTISSPPYGGLKDYGDAQQIGFGQPDDEYLIDIRRVLRAIFDHTRNDGSLWLILDTLRPKVRGTELRRLRMLPFEVGQEAESVGWVLRDIIIWMKDKTVPWSSRGRLRNGFEYVLFFAKSDRFKYHVDRLREPSDLEQWWVKYPERYNPRGKAPSNVWCVPIPVQGSWSNTTIQHACPLPPDLVERMMLLSTDPGDVVMDPFAGSGVVIAEAQRLGRRGIGVELIDRHIRAYHETVRPEILQRRGTDLLKERQDRSEKLRETILDLRAVKYPKVVMQRALEADPSLPLPFAVYAYRRTGKELRIDLVIVMPDDQLGHSTAFLDAVQRATRKAPASKFGVSPTVRVASLDELGRLHRGVRLWAYVGGVTHRAAGVCTSRNVHEYAAQPTRFATPIVVSNVRVDESPRRLRSAESEISEE